MTKINMAEVESMGTDELRAYCRALIASGDLRGIKASETRHLRKPDCIDLIRAVKDESGEIRDKDEADELIEKLKSVLSSKAPKSGAVDMGEIRDEISRAVSKVNARVDTISELLDKAFKDPKAGKRVAVASSAISGNVISDEILKYYKAGESNDTKLMLLSSPSMGKSHAVREASKEYDLFIEHGCSPSLDEIDRLEGSATPDNSGGFTIVDGKLSKAVREASKGKRVLFFFDEILRLSEDAQAFLLTFMTGVKKDGDLVYQITTKHPSGGSLEQIECKAENLHFIAGANLTEITPVRAFWSRFRKFRVEFSRDLAEKISRSILLSYEAFEGSSPDKFCRAYAHAMDKSRKAVKAGSLFESFDMRCLEDAIRSGASNPIGLVKDLEQILRDHSCLWDMDSGEMLEDSRKAFNGIFETFKSEAL